MSLIFHSNNFLMPPDLTLSGRQKSMGNQNPWTGSFLNRETAGSLQMAEKQLRTLLNAKKKKKKQNKHREGQQKETVDQKKRLSDAAETVDHKKGADSVTSLSGADHKMHAGKSSVTADYGCVFPEASEKLPEGEMACIHAMQQAVVWSEILGEPVCRKRQNRR